MNIAILALAFVMAITGFKVEGRGSTVCMVAYLACILGIVAVAAWLTVNT